MAQQQYEANHQPGVRPVAAIRDDPIHVVHARNPQLPLQVPNQPIERRQELPSHLDQDVDKWTEFRKFVIRGLKGKTNSKTYITLVLGSMIRSVTFEYIEKALWVSWGLDTGDGCDSKKLLYVFAQVLMKGEPLSMHVGVRGELGATGKELWDMFFALLSGDDLEYGYDVETKIKIECYGQNNRIGWNADEEEEVKNECNESKYVKKMKKLKNLGVKFGMDPRKVIKSTASICTDGANNFYGERQGFQGHRLRFEMQVQRPRILRNRCVNHKIDIDSDQKGTDGEILKDLEELLKEIRHFWSQVAHYKVLLRVCVEFGVQMRKITKDFELRWLRYMSNSLETATTMIDVWIIACLRLLEPDNPDDDVFDMLQSLLEHYYTILKCNEVIRIYAGLNNFCEYESKTCLDFVLRVEQTLNEFIRLQTGGVIPSILSRLQQAEDADDVLIVSNRLQFIQDEIEAYNQRTDDVIEFDPFFTESFVYDTILNHYINEYRTNYTNMELYRKCCDLFVFSKMSAPNKPINY
eukprot:762187_1